jgi:hypothetical protein
MQVDETSADDRLQQYTVFKRSKNDDPTSQSMLDVEVGSGCIYVYSKFKIKKTPNGLKSDK